ncbi:MAG: adenylyltransferase/cytidyltransferase family protein, partial [Lachnospiraceae bacterium]|nr:adenylyltransferase/cytidyltransferase family protein [Lachnospiraceae bacterium]
MKKVYTCFCTDVIHEGHLNILREAKKYGEVVVGILSDAAMIKYNRFPTISIEQRKQIVLDTGLVNTVITQDEIMYDRVLAEVKPDYVIHGDNWCEGPERAIRQNVIENLRQYGGELIEVAYTYNENVKKIDDNIKEKLAMPEYRRRRLRQLLKLCPVVNTIEVNSGLTGLI